MRRHRAAAYPIPSENAHSYDNAAVLASRIPSKADLIWCCEFVEHVEEARKDNFLAVFKRGRVVAMTHALLCQTQQVSASALKSTESDCTNPTLLRATAAMRRRWGLFGPALDRCTFSTTPGR